MPRKGSTSRAGDPQLAHANELLRAGKLAEAETAANRILAAKRTHVGAISLLAHIAMQRAQFDLAANRYRQAVSIDRRQPALHCSLAAANLARGRFPEALSSYEKALKLAPDLADALAGKAEVLERTGKRDRAAALLEPQVRKGRPTPRMAVVYARAVQGAGRDADVVAFAREQLTRPDLAGPGRRALLLVLGRSLDRLGEHDEAFAAFHDGNSVGAPPFDEAALAREFDELMDAFAPDAVADLARARHGSRLPVFVFGMPRSGTTLIEQIIQSHPAAHGAGEIHDLAHLRTMMPGMMGAAAAGHDYPQCVRDLRPDHVEPLAASYLERLRTYDAKAERIVDKSLENYECLGLIALLFPCAALIHARRHPLDVCFSCFMQDLSPQLHPAASDLRSIGLFYRQYARLMEFWRSHLDVPMLEIDYEDLVANQEAGTRRIIEFLGLPWDDACLRFHESKRDVSTASYDQVRRPIYTTAVARYERYEKHLDPLREALGDALDVGDAADANGSSADA